MKGPADDSAAPTGAVVEEEEQPPRPPGGKVLLRLLQLLEADGLTGLADDVVRSAVPAAEAPRVFEAAREMGILSPERERGSRPRTRSRRRRGNGEAAGEDAGQLEAGVEMAQAHVAAAERMGPPTATGPQWRSIGPWTVTNGQTYGSSRVNVSGRISALAVDPSDPAHVLAGAANGGVWESRDRGASWQPRTDYQATLTVGAIAFDDASSATVYCGTGEGNWWSWLGTGVLRSTDGGTTWASLATAPFVGQGFHSLVPGQANRLFAGTTGGLYRSTNGGTTWTQRRTARTWAISRAATGNELLAACADGVVRSTNNGTNWAAVNLPGAPPVFDRLSVAHAPSDAGVAYAWGARGGTAYLYRRATATGAWAAIGVPPGVATGQAWYDWYLAVSPDNAGQIYCGAIEIHRGDLSGGTWTWRNLSNKGSSGDSIHPDQHSIAFEPGNPATIYAGNDGGVFRSTDRGITWQHCNNGLQVSEYEYIAHDWGSARWVIGGTQDNGTNRWTGPLTWEHVQDGDGGDCGVNRVNPNTVFHTFQNGWLERSATRGGWATWANITPARPAGEGPGLFYVPFEASATTGDTIALGGWALYVSRNLGTTWTRLAYPGAAGVASALFAPDPDTVLVGLTDGRILRTTWAGGAWGALAALTTPRANAWISDLHAEVGGTGRIWATSTRVGGGRVFRSDDGGTTWADSTNNLPALPINAIAVDDGNRNRIWVGADLGVWQSTDGGGTWADFSSSLPNAYVGDVIFHPHTRVLRAGLRNRGVWEIPVDGWMTQPSCGVQWTGTLAANQTARWFTWGWPATWHMVWTVMPTSPAVGAPQVSWSVAVERADAERVTYWITVTNLTAQPVSFEGRYAILSRY